MESWFMYCYSPVLPKRAPPCYQSSDIEFIFWRNGDFGLCFEELVILSLSYATLTLLSSLYSGLKYSRLKRRRPAIGLTIRGIISFCLLINSLTLFISSFWLIDSLSYSILLCQLLQVLCWFTHLVCIFVLSRSSLHEGFGPVPLNLAWGLTLFSTIVHFRTIIRFVLHQTAPYYCTMYTNYFAFVIQITCYIQFSLQVLYLLFLLLPAKKIVHSELYVPHPPLKSMQYEEERTSLLDNNSENGQVVTFESGIPSTDYGSISGRVFKNLGRLEDKANILSLLTFWWLQPLMKRGSMGLLQKPTDLPFLPRSIQTHHVRERFQRFVIRNSQGIRAPPTYFTADEQSMDSMHNSLSDRPTNRINRVSLLRALNRAFGWHYYPLGLIKLFNDCLGFGGPLLLHQLVNFMEQKSEPMSHGYYYALGLFLSTLITAILNSHFTYQVNKVGLKIRAAIITEVFRKSLSVSAVNMGRFSTGQIVNYMSTDTDRIVNFCPSFHQFWSLPFQIIVSLYLLYSQVGLAFLAGLVFCILLIPINRWLAKKIGQLSTEMMSQKDQRVKLMTEILIGIRVIKFYAWEQNFTDRVNGIRAKELKSLRGRKYLDALCVYFWATTPVLISILTFTTYVLIGNTLTAAKVFTSLALFNMLIGPLNSFPWVLNGLVEAWVSLKRIQEFLLLPEIDVTSYYITSGYHDSSDVVSISNGTFAWSEAGGECILNDINITIRKGEFIGVIGKVGSGKSSLLAAITAETRLRDGEIYVSELTRGFGLVSQEPWIQHGTVRDNILFGTPYDVDKYNAVLYACALEQDLKILPAGDMTEVGENGVTLSGGQKARLALARAVYQDKELYLLDDPLAAVDAHVASHLYVHCIMGLLKHKTRILCTHHTSFLNESDCVIVLKDSAIDLLGPPATILTLLEESKHQQTRHKRTHSNKSIEQISNSDDSSPPVSPVSEGEKSDSDGVLVKEEEKEEGVVKFSVYWSYWVSVGMILAPAILFSLFLMQASRNVSDWWLSYWISKTHDINTTTTNNNQSEDDDLKFYLGIYGGLASANTFFTLFRAFLYAYGGIQAARVLHKKLLSAILKSPVWFFDITPIGRIINRFSSDLYAIDDSLPFILNILLAQLFGLLGTLVVTCYGLPWFIVFLVPLGVVYYYIQKYYRRTSRELKRLSTVTLSPVYAHFQETLMGLCVIRAFRSCDRFMRENEEKLEMSQRANYSSYAVAQWLSLRLQMLGVAMIGGVALIAVLEHHFASSVDPGLVGLAISYALSVTNLLSGVVTSFTETEKEMVSVERVMEYIRETPNERGNQHEEDSSSSQGEWPSRGVVEFKKVTLKYREGLAPALKDVTFVTKPAEKVGVVGRTGAGKSSLFQAIFRIVDPLMSGAILIDNVDISSISLNHLRSVLAIIPQDPFLFSGTVKENLDPCDKCSDIELWSALERCHLKSFIENLGGLNGAVEDKGKCFSVGQRQLMCLARALLTRAKIICIDEATASVDFNTDAQIQQTIRTEFVMSTVITIAHRIETVLNCDRILVMDNGRVKEFENPGVLLGDPNSMFSLLFNEYKNKNKNKVFKSVF